MSWPISAHRGPGPFRAALPLALLMLVVAGPGVASAHATLVSTNPVDGVTLGTPPTEVRLVFSEPVAVDLVTVGLADGSGSSVDGISVVADPADDTVAVVRLPALDAGAYRLAWKAVDDVDLHVTSGIIVFGVAVAAPERVAGQAASPGIGEVLARWLDLVALAILAGSLMLLAVTLPRRVPSSSDESRRGARRRLLVAALLGTAGAAVTGSALLALQAAATGGTAGAVLGTAYGTAWVARLAVLAVLAALVAARLQGRADGARGDLAALALVAALAGVQAVVGHVAEGAAGEQPVRVAALTAHVFAAWAWAGGLAILVIAVLPMRRRGPEGAAVVRHVLRRFWRIATPGLAVIAVSGVYLAGQFVATPAALSGSTYGQALLVKMGIASIATSLGLLNASTLHHAVAATPGRLRRSLGRSRPARRSFGGPTWLRRRVVLEAGAALAVVLGASVMAASPPARGPAWDPAAVVDQAPVAVRVDDLMVLLTVRPNRPGPNFVDVTVYQTRKPAPAPVGQVLVGLSAAAGDAVGERLAASLGDSRYELAGDSLSTAGDWRLAVSVRRPGLPDARVAVPWTVLPAQVASATAAGGFAATPLAPLATAAALILAGVLLVTAAIALTRTDGRGRRTTIEVEPATAPSPAGSA